MVGVSPQRKGGFWYLIKRVPAAFQHLDTRGIVKVSTRIRVADDPKGIRATQRVQELSAELDRYWRDLADGRNPHAARDFQKAKEKATALGFDYRPMNALVEGDIDELVRRIEFLTIGKRVEDAPTVAAVLGAHEPAPIMLSDLLREYEQEKRTYISRFSTHQLHRWRVDRQRALNEFIGVVGDKPLKALTRDDALKFRSWWQDRVARDGLDVQSANKSIGHISGMLRTISDNRQLGLHPIFTRLALEGEKTKQRVAFDPTFIQDVILAEGALSKLNAEARRVVLVCIETGMRPTEVVNLRPEHIHLDAPVPYVEVKAAGRVLKTEHSERSIPLVGVALEAMLLQPNGFPRYRDKSNGLSATVNKFFKDNNLSGTEGQSLYSFRHSFEDRLTAVECPEKIVAALMGHKWHRPKYGRGPTLDHVREWLRKIAFRAPRSI